MPKINALQQNLLKPQVAEKASNSNKANITSFSDTLKDMINQVDTLQKNSKMAIENFISGDEGNLHEVMAAVEEAQLSFQLMMEIRNKLLESYHELMRMQV